MADLEPQPLSESLVLIKTHTTEHHNNNSNINKTTADAVVPEIPTEIVSEEEMALLDAAFSAARASLFSSSSVPSLHFVKNVRSITSISLLSSKRPLARCNSNLGLDSVVDIEDSGEIASTQKRIRVNESLLQRFRKKRGLSVTDITATEWCEKQMEFVLVLGKAKKTQAMKAGSARHVVLEEEVVKRVKIRTESIEDVWAVRFINFIVGAHQLLFEGLTRELPIIGFEDGVWIVGVIDEIQMSATEGGKPKLVDTKTRARATLPSVPQQRNGRLQLMCYKLLWDKLVAVNFPFKKFFDFFALNPHHVLSEEIRERTATSGFPVQTLEDLVKHFTSACHVLPTAHEELLLRYEFQKDNSLLGEDNFSYDADWLESQLKCSLEFWVGEREARIVPEEERWKCGFCQFASECPRNTNSGSTPADKINSVQQD